MIFTDAADSNSKKYSRRLGGILVLAFGVLAGGCSPPQPAADKPKSPTGIIGKMTSEIGEFDPSQAREEADLTIDSSKPLKAITSGAYKSILGQAAKLQITQALNLFNAEHGRFPKDHAEFMEKIVGLNNLQLPVLPGKVQYQYDVANHELIIVEAE